ncbi:hypothetical protein VTI28DRAFT_2484 [Corynascus sepedonium]
MVRCSWDERRDRADLEVSPRGEFISLYCAVLLKPHLHRLRVWVMPFPPGVALEPLCPKRNRSSFCSSSSSLPGCTTRFSAPSSKAMPYLWLRLVPPLSGS